MRRLVALSSTTSTRSPARASADNAWGGSAGLPTPRLAVEWKAVPSPSTLSPQILPPIFATRCLETDSPRPVPPNLRAVEPFFQAALLLVPDEAARVRWH